MTCEVPSARMPIDSELASAKDPRGVSELLISASEPAFELLSARDP